MLGSEVRKIPSKYESEPEESVTFSKHVIEEGSSRYNLPRPLILPGASYVDQSLRREEVITREHATKYEGMGVGQPKLIMEKQEKKIGWLMDEEKLVEGKNKNG